MKNEGEVIEINVGMEFMDTENVEIVSCLHVWDAMNLN
jgi:hypothetical protein